MRSRQPSSQLPTLALALLAFVAGGAQRGIALDVETEREHSSRAEDPLPKPARSDTTLDKREREPASGSELFASTSRLDARLEAAAQDALERGLAWLAARSRAESDALLPPVGLSASEGRGFATLAVQALAALAWMGEGNAPGRGRYGADVEHLIDYLLARCAIDPDAAQPGFCSHAGDGLSRMHGHGFATLALAQAWTMSPTDARGARIARALPLAVECIEASQGSEGGWWYEPRRSLEHEGSITITMAQALRGARHAGVRVDTGTIARAVDYVKRSQKEDGSFRYALADSSSSVALTAAAIATLEAAGTHGGKELEEGYDWLFRALAAREATGGEEPNPLDRSGWKQSDKRLYCRFYERLYVAQCLWQHADPQVFARWNTNETRRVVTTQLADGSWHDPQFGDAYATAMCCLFLEVPLGLLPIFQR